MKYLYTTRQDYTDFARGRVFMSFPGRPAFPVRLASEIFQRCLAAWPGQGGTRRCNLYDPCCGGAYLLSTVAYLHWHHINYLIGSDVDEGALELAERNLSLVTPEGMQERTVEIETMLARYGKDSHAEALTSARRLNDQLRTFRQAHKIKPVLFQADATNGAKLENSLEEIQIDLVMTDLPYGHSSFWQGEKKSTTDYIWEMLEAFLGVLGPEPVVAIVSDKGQKIGHGAYRRLEQIRIGKRQVTILMLR
jgi:tRNA G10  N-methylase Trm11